MTMIIDNEYNDYAYVYCAYMREVLQEKMRGKFRKLLNWGPGVPREVRLDVHEG